MTQFELHQGDCLEVMKTLPDNSVDSIVTDPPYGISFMGKKWDYDVPGVDVWAEALRLLKPGGHILVACGTRTQHRMVVNIEDARFFYCAKASKSDRNGGLDGFPVDRPDSRTAIGMGTFEEKGVQPQQNHHPTVKPTALMQYLCRLITPPGGTVLDPYTGSGSTGKAAMFEDFRFIGIERELEYVEIATARIEAARTREPLFLEADSQKTQGGLF